MRKLLAGGLALVLAVSTAVVMIGRNDTQGADVKPMIVHSVFFSLKDNSPAAKQKLVAGCKEYLTKHEGEAFFSAGTRAEEFDRELNDKDFDVALLIVFKDKAAHDKYQDAARHKKFIAENKDNWKKVRVFDSHGEK